MAQVEVRVRATSVDVYTVSYDVPEEIDATDEQALLDFVDERIRSGDEWYSGENHSDGWFEDIDFEIEEVYGE